MKPKLTHEEIYGKKSMIDLYQHYFPDSGVAEADYFIWNETCYPFDFDRAHDMIYKKYQEKYKLMTEPPMMGTSY